MKKIILLLIVCLALFLRLYRFDYPLADWHSWRQADTAAVSRNFIKNGVDLLHPKFDDLSNVASGLENPQGHRFVEFPAYNFLHAKAYQAWPAFSLVAWGRVLSAAFSVLSVLFLFLICYHFLGEKAAFLAALFYAVNPFAVYYGRVILPEPMMVVSGLGMIWFFILWNEKKLKITPKSQRDKSKLKESLDHLRHFDKDLFYWLQGGSWGVGSNQRHSRFFLFHVYLPCGPATFRHPGNA